MAAVGSLLLPPSKALWTYDWLELRLNHIINKDCVSGIIYDLTKLFWSIQSSLLLMEFERRVWELFFLIIDIESYGWIDLEIVWKITNVYSLHPIISALLDYKISPKISAHLHMSQTNSSYHFLLYLSLKCNDYNFYRDIYVISP